MKSTIRCVAFFIVIALLTRESVTLAQTSDGRIVAWGYNNLGQCDVPPPNTGFTAVAAGIYHSLGLQTDGSIVAWGRNQSGECSVPSPNTDFRAVAAGGDYYFSHSLGLKADGSIVAWGSNWAGQCTVPAPNMGFVAVAAGWNHSLGLKVDGSIAAWGYNASGECDVPSPNAGFTAVEGGWYHSLGLKSDGSIVAWGRNDHGQCSVPSPNTGFTAVAAGYEFSLGLKADGSIVAWGDNAFGQCNVPSPSGGFIVVAAGGEGSGSHGLGLTADGSIVAWGSNNYGQCTLPSPNSGFTAAAAGGWHSLAIRRELPISVYLASFTAERRGSEMLIRWTIAQSVAGVVFRLWRQEPGRERVCLSQALLSGQTAYDYTDPTPPVGPVDYWLQETTTNSSANWYGPAHLNAAPVPSDPHLYQNAPNSFNPRTTIRFDLPGAGEVRLAVYDIAGRLVRVLVAGEQSAGTHVAVWDGRDDTGRAMASGSYLARLEAGGKSEVVRMALVR